VSFSLSLVFKYRREKKLNMTHPLFVGTPVDDLPRELQRLIASYLPLRHPVATLALVKITQFETRVKWWYSKIYQIDLFCMREEVQNLRQNYYLERNQALSDWLQVERGGGHRRTMGKVPSRHRLLLLLRTKGIKVKRGLSTYHLHLTLTQGTQPVRRWTLQPSSPSESRWVREG
jgi:hypothetical protein